ncbi:hypothetical protein O3W44_07625 [Pantoea sp. LMR881]|uniref:hypothetical protein n=1 Tax=Pantoea sp. LMR881 TaxID=3014336 RepID=UPI0022AEBF1E|nr:hypothetical protein [Pantoea sp. LMR881]MCZ4058974.1 hypothetical protein [Pantoea sp. LMR881]
MNGNGGSTKPGNNNGATKWPEVKTNTDFIGGTGSSQRLPGGQTGKPHDRPDFNGNSARPDGAKGNDGVNSANQNVGDKNSGGTQSPEVKTNTDFIGGTGSPSRIPGGQTGKPHDRPDFNGNSARPDGAKGNDGVNSANQNAGDKNSGGTQSPEVKTNTDFIGGTGSPSRIPGGQTGKPHDRPDFNGNSARPDGANANDGVNSANQNAGDKNSGGTQSPEVKTNTDFIGGTGSPSRIPGGQTGKPHDRPDFNGNSARPDGAKGNDGVNGANQNAGDKNSGGTQSPEVKTNTDFIGGTGSPSRIPGGQTGKPHDRPDFNGDIARPGAPDKTANLSAPYSHNEWRSLLPETIIFKSDKKMS